MNTHEGFQSVDTHQPMPAEAWSDHEDANAQFEMADREAMPWIWGALCVFIVAVGLAGFLFSLRG